MNWRNRITLALTWTLNWIAPALVPLVLIGCGGGHTTVTQPPPPKVTTLTVSPASITAPAGSATTFTGVFAPTAPAGGSLTWSITPVDGGTITSAGIYTASSTAGKYSIVATWTPSLSSEAIILKGSAAVNLLAVPQLDAVITPDQVQASGATQSAGAIQNGAVAGQGIPSVLSTDSGGNTQVLSGFTIPASDVVLIRLANSDGLRDIFKRKERSVCATDSAFWVWF